MRDNDDDGNGDGTGAGTGIDNVDDSADDNGNDDAPKLDTTLECRYTVSSATTTFRLCEAWYMIGLG